jgi:hypothetical protein
VKGDAGDVIEVRSASDGAACGFEFWDADQRIGAVIHEENGVLRGSLCSQVDPEVLLAAMLDPTPSATGIGRLLIGGGWSSTRLIVLDEEGGLVTDVRPPGQVDRFIGTQALEGCPGGHYAVQLTPEGVNVWDLTSFELVTSHEVASADGMEWLADLTCRSEDASEIWGVFQTETDATLATIPEREPLASVSGSSWEFGPDFVITQSGSEDDPVLVDLTSGEKVRLHETPPNAQWAINVSVHPTTGTIALTETRFNEDIGPVEATLFIMDRTGAVHDRFEIPWETYSPVWLDDHRVAIHGYDYSSGEESATIIFDVDDGDSIEIADWTAEHLVADADTIYGLTGGDVVTADLTTGEAGKLVTLPLQNAGPLVLLEGETPITTTTTSPAPENEPSPASTVPPLLAPGSGPHADPGVPAGWIAGVAATLFAGVLIWLSLPRRGSADSSD